MTFSPSDLLPLLTPPPQQAVRYGQGKILAWDPETFQNSIEWRGITLTDVPVLSGAEALTYQPGDTVGLLGWAPQNGGLGSWWILGRLVIPGSGAGERAIEWMASELGRAVSAAVFAERIHEDRITGLAGNAPGDPSWGDLDDGPGPTVTDVEVTDAGRMLVGVGAQIFLPSEEIKRLSMSFEVSGASSVAPQSFQSVAFASQSSSGRSKAVKAFQFINVEGLNAGLHTVQAQYQRLGGTAANGEFSSRQLLVITF